MSQTVVAMSTVSAPFHQGIKTEQRLYWNEFRGPSRLSFGRWIGTVLHVVVVEYLIPLFIDALN